MTSILVVKYRRGVRPIRCFKLKCPGPRAYAAKAQVMVMGSMIRIRPIKKIEKPVHPRTSLTQALGASSIVNFDLGAPHSGHL